MAQLNVTEKVKHEAEVSKSVNVMCFTATGNALVCFDDMATMFICRMSPITDPGILIIFLAFLQSNFFNFV